MWLQEDCKHELKLKPGSYLCVVIDCEDDPYIDIGYYTEDNWIGSDGYPCDVSHFRFLPDLPNDVLKEAG